MGKYLGCPFFQGWPSYSTFQKIFNKATTILEGWKANCLSKAGRTILIQSHLESLPTHTMQCFELPSSTSKYLDKCNREFFWKKSNTEKGLPLVSWDKACRPKSRGGSGLQKIEAINKAFQCKLTQKILTNVPILWVQSMRAKYLCSTNLFCCTKKKIRIRQFGKAY